MDLRPVQKSSASGAVFDQLFEELMKGRIPAGSPLPAERALTEILKVNRQAVREALQRLSQAGLIDIRQGEPTRALDYRRSATLDLLPHLLVTPAGDPDPGTARSVMEMRACIGPDVARLAASRALSQETERLQELQTAIAEESDLSVLADLDLEFWDVLVDAADNIAYRLAFNSLRRTYEPLRESLSIVLAAELTDVEAHRSIADAVRDGDGESAASAAQRLLAKGSAALTEALASLETEGEGTR